ncbi:replication initiator protein A [Candidatus Avoscillospira sp. LCP25S3_F1]|uniref:replication initiator protein A n=1 Tax=Candidatus Avoscillospira sp. LCP25S3_F1 TaxID=3438825 RepID=UPI003F8FC4F8
MEAVPMKERPPYPLLTASHRVEADFYQMPRWLLARQDLSLDAKLVYMLLYDRFRLSQKNGWVNEHSEVYLIYPRQELAQTLGVHRKRITAAMRELAAASLLWEQNGGYSVANQIYLAWGEPVDISEDNLSVSCGNSPLPF